MLSSLFGVAVGYSVLIPYTFSLFIKPLGLAFGWRRDQISIAFGCVALTVALCAPLTGYLLDRCGPKRVIIPCILIFGTAFASLSLLTPNLAQFFLVFILLGLAANGTTQLAYSRTVSSWFVRRRGMALALVSAGAGAGSMVLPLLAAWLIERYGWRAAYRDLGLLVIVVSLPLAAIFVREPAGIEAIPHRRIANSWRRPAAGRRPFLFLVVAICLYAISFNALISHLAPLLTDRGWPLHLAAEALSTLGLCGFVGRLLTGYLLDRFFAPWVSAILFLVTVAALLLLGSRSMQAAFIGVALMGFAAGGESDLTPYLLSRYYSLRSFSTLYGCAWTAFAVGTAIGPFLMGKLFVAAGGYQRWGIDLFALPAFASALLMMRMPPYPIGSKCCEKVSDIVPLTAA